ncbi:MAG TPA: glycosyltransferase [Candidatus Competibacteraceae bacterium]|nr:glycosyltransferase [Candidatus Competibacteraceae bacterium]
MTGRIAVIIINYRRAADTVECLDSLLRVAAPAFDIFLLDNGSSASDVAQLTNYAAHHPDRIAFTAFPENYGFTGAHNRLFAQLLPTGYYEFFLLLNNDAVVAPDFLQHMLERVDLTQHIEMVAARS